MKGVNNMSDKKQFEADCDKSGEWFVFDNEACYCCAGPMDEYSAIELAIKLNLVK